MDSARWSNLENESVATVPGRIPSLDGLRALSIALVLVAHAALASNAPHFLVHFRHLGNVGVRCFFVISGFLITTLLVKEHARTGLISLPQFYLRRALRIFPPSILYILVICGCSALGYLFLLPGDILHALSYTMNYHEIRAWWFEHLWSLSVEEQFYILWPGLLFWLGVRRSSTLLWWTIAMAPLVRGVMWTFLGATPTAMTRHFEANADALAIGCLLSLYYNRLGAAKWYQRFGQSRSIWLLALGMVVVGNGLFLASQGAFYTVGQTLANFGTALGIELCIRNPKGMVGKLFNWAPLAYLGTLSYSIYLWQGAFLNPDWVAWPTRFPNSLALVFVMALVSYYLVERPFLRMKPSPVPRTRSGVGSRAVGTE